MKLFESFYTDMTRDAQAMPLFKTKLGKEQKIVFQRVFAVIRTDFFSLTFLGERELKCSYILKLSLILLV